MELRGLVQKEHAAVRQGNRSGPRDTGPAAHQGLHGRRMVRCAVRRPGDQRFAGREDPRDRVDGRDLHGVLSGQRRQDPGQPLGQHRLARARGSAEEEVVPSGGRHLQGAARRLLPGHVGEVGEVRGVPRPERPGASPAPSPAPGTSRPTSIGSGRPGGSGGSSSGTAPPVRTAISWRRLRTPSTETSGTSAASAAHCCGTTTCRYPASIAARTMRRIPGPDGPGRPVPAPR